MKNNSNMNITNKVKIDMHSDGNANPLLIFQISHARLVHSLLTSVLMAASTNTLWKLVRSIR